MRFPEIIARRKIRSEPAMANSASDYQQSDTAERSGFIVDAVSDDVGKGLFATKEFAAGETIFRERPLVSAQVTILIELQLQADFNLENLVTNLVIVRKVLSNYHHLTTVLLERALWLPVLPLLHGTPGDGAGKRTEVGFFLCLLGH